MDIRKVLHSMRHLIRKDSKEKIKDDPIVDEYNRMTKYLRDKYGEDFKET